MKSRSEKLPGGRSYPIKPSIFASAVEASGIKLPVQLTQWDRFEHAFTADFLPNGWPLQYEHALIWVHCRAVASHHASAARDVVVGQIIPRFIEWAKWIDDLDRNSPIRREKQTFVFPMDQFAS